MKLAISEEKINTEAAALEICRNEIIIDLERKFRIKEVPWNFHKLLDSLEGYLMRDKYSAIRSKIVSNMDSAEQTMIPDYKVEMYIKNFIIEPLMDDNHQRLLATLKTAITEQFIDKFPITTLILEPTVVNRLGLNRNGLKPADTLYTAVQTFLPVLDLAKNFDGLLSAIVREVNYFEYLANTVPENQDYLKRVTADTSSLIRILEFNCWIILDLCCRILKTVVENYRVELLLSRDDIAKLEHDFKDFCRQRIIKDNRYLGKMSPNSFYSSINGYCKDAWARIKKKISNDLAVREKNKVSMPYTERAMFKHSFFKHFKDDVEITLTNKLKIVPREEVFLYSNYTNVSQNIDTMIDHCFNQMVIGMKDAVEALRYQVQDMLTNMYQPTTQYKYKQFQLTPKVKIEEVLSLANRRLIVLCALVSTPKTQFPVEYAQHMHHIAKLASDLEVISDPEFKQMYAAVGTLQIRKANAALIDQTKKRCEQAFSSNGSLKLTEVAYLVFGLYFLVTDGYRDMDEMRRAFEQTDLIRFSAPSYKRRRLLFQIIRFIKNGHFFLLNYSIVHMIEMMIDRQRAAHNRYMHEKVLKKDIRQTYVIEYNDVIKMFKEMPIAQLAKLVEGSHHGFQDPQRARRDALFKSSFISDTTFDEQNVSLSRDNLPMVTVNKVMTIEKATAPARLKTTSNLSESSFLRASQYSMEMDESIIVSPTICPHVAAKEEDLRFHGKLQYLQENIRTFEFISLQKDRLGHSRFPILVLSGFMSENSNKMDDWKQMIDLFPYTELVTINWEALTPTQIFSNYMTTLNKVSVGSIANMLAGQLNSILSSKQEASRPEMPDSSEQMDTNPFEKANRQEENDNSGVKKESGEEESNPGIFGLFKKAKMKDIFNADNLTLVRSNHPGGPELVEGISKPSW
jgi:hypothetical protein